jgi:hypothetical protein
MTDSAAAVLALIDELKAKLAAGRSYRQICREDYGGQFSHSVLNNLVLKGIVPADRRIRQALGLIRVDEATAYARQFKRTFTKLLKALR